MILINDDEGIIESYTFSEWPFKLRTGKIILTDKSFYALEGTWGIKTSIQCKYDQIIHIEYKESMDHNYLILGVISLIFYFFIVTIPLGLALIHIGLQKQLKIGIELYGFKTIHGPSNVLLRVLKQLNQKTNLGKKPIRRDREVVFTERSKEKKSINQKVTENKFNEYSVDEEKKFSNPPFYCQICALKHPAGTQRMQCDACGRSICIDSFSDMAKAGRTKCPMCDGKLTAF